jgi:hypothetical protein
VAPPLESMAKDVERPGVHVPLDLRKSPIPCSGVNPDQPPIHEFIVCNLLDRYFRTIPQC